MTLVETIVASIIGCLVLMLLFGLFRGVHRGEAQVDSKVKLWISLNVLRERLAWDLVRMSPCEFVDGALCGPSSDGKGLDLAMARSGLEPVPGLELIRYRFDSTHGTITRNGQPLLITGLKRVLFALSGAGRSTIEVVLEGTGIQGTHTLVFLLPPAYEGLSGWSIRPLHRPRL